MSFENLYLLFFIDYQNMENDKSLFEFLEDKTKIRHTFETPDEIIYLDLLYKVIERTDDLDVLVDIKNMLLGEKKMKTAAVKKLCRQNADVKDKLNTAKCYIQELEQLHRDEVQKADNIVKRILIKKNEVLDALYQQVNNLDQFKLGASEINKFAPPPKEYENSRFIEKIDNVLKTLDEPTSVAPAMELASSSFDYHVIELTSLKKNLAQLLEQLTKEADKLQLSKMSANFRSSDKN